MYNRQRASEQARGSEKITQKMWINKPNQGKWSNMQRNDITRKTIATRSNVKRIRFDYKILVHKHIYCLALYSLNMNGMWVVASEQADGRAIRQAKSYATRSRLFGRSLACSFVHPPLSQKAQKLLAYAITIAAFEAEQTIFALRSSTQRLVLHLPKAAPCPLPHPPPVPFWHTFCTQNVATEYCDSNLIMFKVFKIMLLIGILVLF